MNRDHVIQSISTWIEHPDSFTCGFLEEQIPSSYRLLEKLMEDSNESKDSIKSIKRNRNELVKLGELVFGSIDPLLIQSYFHRVEFTFHDQQPSITHPIYIISSSCKPYITDYLDDLFTWYREGHSQLHSIASPCKVDHPHISQWFVRSCEYGFLYHHPDYITYRVQSFPNDRPYDHLITNAISQYASFFPNHTIDAIHEQTTCKPTTRIMFVMNEIQEDFPEFILPSLMEYDTPLCLLGIIPYMIPRLPPSLFEIRYQYVFDDSDQMSFYMVRLIYYELPVEVEDQLINIKHDVTDEKVKTFLTEHCSAWLGEFTSQPYCLVRCTCFSWIENLEWGRRLNRILYNLHPQKITME